VQRSDPTVVPPPDLLMASAVVWNPSPVKVFLLAVIVAAILFTRVGPGR
jgi:hypothetical protein